MLNEKINKIFRDKKQILFCFLSVFVFGFIAYAFAFFNPSTSIDANAFNMSWEREHQYAIGRIFQPLYRRIFGLFHAPFFNGLIWLTFLALSIYYLSEIFNLNKITIVFFSAILTISACFVKTTSLCPQWNGIYSLSLFLGVLSVYLTRKYKLGWIGLILLNTVVCGLYQSYVCVSVGLCIVCAIKDLLQGKTIKEVLVFLLKSAVCILIAFVIYMIAYELVLKLFDIEKAKGYNSTASVGKMGLKRIIVLCAKTYILFFRNLVLFSDYQEVGMFNGFVGVQEIFAGLLLIFAISISIYYFYKMLKDKAYSISKIFVMLFLIACLPFGFAFVCVLSNGNGLINMYIQNFLIYLIPIVLYKEYAKQTSCCQTYSLKTILIITSIISIFEVLLAGIVIIKFKNDDIVINFLCQSLVLFVFPIVLFVKYRKSLLNENKKTFTSKSILSVLIAFISIGLIFNSVIYANEQHSKHYLQSQKRLSVMTLLVDRIEIDDDYTDGDTIYVYGHFGVLCATNGASVNSYLSSVLGRGYSFVFVDEPLDIFTEIELNNEIVGDKMNSFPSNNCLKRVGDKLVLKLSEIE